jgi:hypothetical protein
MAPAEIVSFGQAVRQQIMLKHLEALWTLLQVPAAAPIDSVSQFAWRMRAAEPAPVMDLRVTRRGFMHSPAQSLTSRAVAGVLGGSVHRSPSPMWTSTPRSCRSTAPPWSLRSWQTSRPPRPRWILTCCCRASSHSSCRSSTWTSSRPPASSRPLWTGRPWLTTRKQVRSIIPALISRWWLAAFGVCTRGMSASRSELWPSRPPRELADSGCVYRSAVGARVVRRQLAGGCDQPARTRKLPAAGTPPHSEGIIIAICNRW